MSKWSLLLTLVIILVNFFSVFVIDMFLWSRVHTVHSVLHPVHFITHFKQLFTSIVSTIFRSCTTIPWVTSPNLFTFFPVTFRWFPVIQNVINNTLVNISDSHLFLYFGSFAQARGLEVELLAQIDGPSSGFLCILMLLFHCFSRRLY